MRGTPAQIWANLIQRSPNEVRENAKHKLFWVLNARWTPRNNNSRKTRQQQRSKSEPREKMFLAVDKFIFEAVMKQWETTCEQVENRSNRWEKLNWTVGELSRIEPANRWGTGEETQKNLILKNKLTAADLLMNVNAAVNLMRRERGENLTKPYIVQLTAQKGLEQFRVRGSEGAQKQLEDSNRATQ